MPSNEERRGCPLNNRKVAEGIIYRQHRAGIPWRDLPREEFRGVADNLETTRAAAQVLSIRDPTYWQESRLSNMS